VNREALAFDLRLEALPKNNQAINQARSSGMLVTEIVMSI